MSPRCLRTGSAFLLALTLLGWTMLFCRGFTFTPAAACARLLRAGRQPWTAPCFSSTARNRKRYGGGDNRKNYNVNYPWLEEGIMSLSNDKVKFLQSLKIKKTKTR